MVEIVQEPRWVYVTDASKKELDFLREYYSFFSPTARYDRRYKQYQMSLWHAQQNGEENPVLRGWDGKIRMFKDGRIPAGLYRATRRDLRDRLDIRVRKVLPEVDFRFQLEAGEPDPKYQFQKDCVAAMHKATKYGGGIVLSATGSGKTKMAADYFRGLSCTCLFVVDTIDLLHQSAKEIEQWLEEEVGVVGEGQYMTARVTVATSQTLDRHIEDRKFRKWYYQVQIVLVDELHEQMGKRNFNVLEKIEPRAVIGLTATLQLSLKPVRYRAWSFCGPVIYEFPIAKATRKQVVTEGAVLQLVFPHDPDRRYAKGMEGYFENYKEEVTENRTKMRACYHIADLLLEKEKHVLVLADRISHVDSLAKNLPEPNYPIRGAVKRQTRDEFKRIFETGKSRLMIASKVFKKGVSIKRVDAMVDVAEGGSKNDALQKFGRGVRLHSKKTFLYYIDIGTDGGRFGTRAKTRLKAFQEAGIPVRRVLVTSAKSAVRRVQEFLKTG